MTTLRRSKPVIRLWGIAGSCNTVIKPLGFQMGRQLVDFIQTAFAPDFRVTADARMLQAVENDHKGGRNDDTRRAREIEKTLSDDNIVAAINLRGGAWLTRVLPQINFRVLDTRTRPIAIFGFSEITTLLNITAANHHVVAYHDLCPSMFTAAKRNRTKLQMRRNVLDFFTDVRRIIRGQPSQRTIDAKIVHGSLPTPKTMSLIGGNLTLLTTLIGTPHAKTITPRKNRWLLIEDVHETPWRIDRKIAHLALAGYLNRYEGFVVGRFTNADKDITAAALICLKKQLANTNAPIIRADNIGHVLPIAPVPLGKRVIRFSKNQNHKVIFDIAWNKLRIL